MRKITLTVGLVLAIIIAITFVFVLVQIRQGWPRTRGELGLAGLQSQVLVLRDGRGIPHIYAENSHDLFMAQGYVHAQDRFWQMEFWRHIGQGRLSENLGKSQIGTDKYLRTLGIVDSAHKSWSLLDKETQLALEAYADGVNAYLKEQKRNLPLEFRILALTGNGISPEPWQPIHTLTWSSIMALQLGGNYDNELYRAELAARYGERWMRELTLYDYPEDRPLIISQEAAWDRIDTKSAMSPPEGLPFGKGLGIGSNNWVIHGDHTETGKPYLANDPHLSIQLPSIWYENGLHCQIVSSACPYNVVGFTFASAPGVIIGHNDHIAWGVTNAYPDVQDLYIERINPSDPHQYEVDGEWVDMDISWEEILIAGQDEPERFPIRRTRHGPIINDVAYGSEDSWAFGWQPLALRWTVLDGNRLPQAILRLNQAQNWEQFRAALQFWDAPSQNIVYADVDGNIGYQMPGKMPRRGHDGLTPVPGWTSDYDWQGYVTFEDLPSVMNPSQGFVVTANNQVADLKAYPFLNRHEGAPGDRALRITEMIQTLDKVTIEDIQSIHGDNANLLARDLIPYLQTLPVTRPEVIAARDLLLDWDLQQDMDSPEAGYFEAFWYELAILLFSDELGEDIPRDRALVRNLLADPNSHWWDDITTATVETRDDILAQALEEGYEFLTGLSGPDVDAWQWGNLHGAIFAHEPLGKSGIDLLERLVNRGPVRTAGGTAIVNATGQSNEGDNPFRVFSLPSLRMIVDLADFNRSLSIITTGQSGHPFHPHYNDQIDPWRRIEYGPMLWRKDDIEPNSDRLLLLPP